MKRWKMCDRCGVKLIMDITPEGKARLLCPICKKVVEEEPIDQYMVAKIDALMEEYSFNTFKELMDYICQVYKKEIEELTTLK